MENLTLKLDQTLMLFDGTTATIKEISIDHQQIKVIASYIENGKIGNEKTEYWNLPTIKSLWDQDLLAVL